ncbi:Pol polyprotein, putative, partial [Perkinsus marinus ATCC 50983]
DVLKMPMDASGNSILVTASDTFTKWVEARVVRREDAFSVIEALVSMFTSLGLPSYIKTDRGSVFRSHVMQQLAQRFGAAKIKYGSSYHPQSQGQIERWHRTFLMMLKSFGQQFANCWSAALPLLLYCYRTTPSTTTHVTPFRAMFGRD